MDEVQDLQALLETAEADNMSKNTEYAYSSNAIKLKHKPTSVGDKAAVGNASRENVIAHDPSNLGCPISYEEYDVGHIVVNLPCNHTFHGACLKQYHEQKFACPQCTRELGWTFCMAASEEGAVANDAVADDVAAVDIFATVDADTSGQDDDAGEAEFPKKETANEQAG